MKKKRVIISFIVFTVLFFLTTAIFFEDSITISPLQIVGVVSFGLITSLIQEYLLKNMK
jgi:hypothetical protein